MKSKILFVSVVLSFAYLPSLHAAGGELGAQCIEAFTSNGYDVGYGQRVSLCQRLTNQFSLEAVQTATNASQSISDGTLASLVRVNGPRSLACVQAFVSNGYSIDYGLRASECLATGSSYAARAIRVATDASQSISDGTLLALTGINSEYALQAVEILVSNGYSIDYGQRADICQGFRSASGVEALRAVADASQSLDDQTLRNLSHIGPSVH